MKKILNQTCKVNGEPGLLLLSMPTGFGKTYAVIEYIYENYQAYAAQGRKILFVTNLKKNLPIQDLKKRFAQNTKQDKKQDEFAKHVLFIDSNSTAVRKALPAVEDEIPERLKSETFTKLRSHINTLDQSKELPKAVQTILETEIRTKLEPSFRRSITDNLHEQFKTKKERLRAIKNDPEYRWIGKLYPCVFTDERTILFLSMDKFVVKNTTLIEPSYYIHERLIDNALIFIDEFDATKEIVLKNIINSGLRHRVDLLDLFLNIHNHLMQSQYPDALLKESRYREELQIQINKTWIELPQIISTFREKAAQIFETYNLQNTCKSHENFSTGKRNFLFYDYQFHHVLDARHKRLEIITDSENRSNWITANKSKSPKQGQNIRSLLRDIAGFLTYFQRGIRYLADNYCHLKEEDTSVQDVFPFESAIKTVLNQFRLDTDEIAFLTANIIEDNVPYETSRERYAIENQSFYDNGFRYHDIVDSDDHDTLSKIYMYNFSRTPESFLLSVCNKAMVVGASATAGLYTNIGNYDLEYLKSKLGHGFIRLTGETLDRLKNAYTQSTVGYGDISICTSFLEVEMDKGLEQLECLLKDQEAALALKNRLCYAESDSGSTVEYNLCRYVRALYAWKYFLDHPDCQSFLCLFNKLPKIGDSMFDLNIVYEYASLLVLDAHDVTPEAVFDIIVVLSGDDFDAAKKQITSDLAGGKRRFIISAYQTVGAGQNLQYPIPESLNPVHINDYPQRPEMDINGIYLDRVTNLLENIFGEGIEDDAFIKYLFQMEFLVENGAISPRVFRNKLDEVFYRYVGRRIPKRKTEDYINLYHTDAYTRFLNKVVIQAIGRICRTNMKAETIHILADKDVRKHLSRFSLPQDVIPVHEYAALLKTAKEIPEQSDTQIEIQNRAALRSDRTMAHIQRQLRTPWTSDSVNEWQNLREQVLIQPTISLTSTCDPQWDLIYIELPDPSNSYYYSQNRDYRDIEIFFSQEGGYQEVSERAAHLPDLMKIELLRKLFQESEWATSFPKSKYMLAPPMFNNIYKGALGEVCGQCILEYAFNTRLRELNVEEFEAFDYKTEQGVYIDFKLWNDQIAVDSEEVLSNIRKKMERVHASKVLIINILGTKEAHFYPIESSDKRIIEVPYLCKNGSIDEAAIAYLAKEFYI